MEIGGGIYSILFVTCMMTPSCQWRLFLSNGIQYELFIFTVVLLA